MLPATAATSSSAIGTRYGTSADTNAMIAEALAAELITMVSTKSTIDAPMGTNAMPSPNASPARSRAAALRVAGDLLVVVDDDKHHDHDDQAHRGQQQREVRAQGMQRGLDGVGDRRDLVGHHGEGEREQQHIDL
jgi:hypothetical protein